MKLELDRRERVALVCAFLALWMVFAMLVFIPMVPQKKYRGSQDRLAETRRELQMKEMLKADEEDRLRRQEKVMERLNARPQNFELLSFLNTKLKDANLSGRFALENYRTRQSSPKQPMAQLKLQGVALDELVDFLHAIYSGNSLVVMYKLERLRPATNNKGLDCELILATVKV